MVSTGGTAALVLLAAAFVAFLFLAVRLGRVTPTLPAEGEMQGMREPAIESAPTPESPRADEPSDETGPDRNQEDA